MPAMNTPNPTQSQVPAISLASVSCRDSHRRSVPGAEKRRDLRPGILGRRSRPDARGRAQTSWTRPDRARGGSVTRSPDDPAAEIASVGYSPSGLKGIAGSGAGQCSVLAPRRVAADPVAPVGGRGEMSRFSGYPRPRPGQDSVDVWTRDRCSIRTRSSGTSRRTSGTTRRIRRRARRSTLVS